MSRLSRLVGIILYVQSRSVVRAEDLAEHFGVSVRTIYRDLRALEEAGLPIAAEAGHGYSMVEGYTLPPIMFTQEEGSALMIGAELMERVGDESTREAVTSALMKIQAVLPSERKEFLERLRNAIAVYYPGACPDESRGARLTTVQEAVATGRVIRILYRSGNDEITEREVEPLGMAYYAEHWHIIGLCRLRNDVRDFRADRIQRLDLLDERFAPREEFSVREHIERSMNARPRIQARVLFNKRTARFTTDRVFLGFVEETVTPDGVEMTFALNDLDWLARWLLRFGSGAVALDPPELRQRVVALAEEVLDSYAPLTTPISAIDAGE